MLVKFCQQRANAFLASHDAERFQTYLLDLLVAHMPPPKTGGDYDWHTIADACGVDHADLKRAARALAPGLDALNREVARKGRSARTKPKRPARLRTSNVIISTAPAIADEKPAPPPRKRGPRAKPIVDFPEDDGKPWTDPVSFTDALDLHMRRHKDSAKHLAKALAATGSYVDAATIRMWRRSLKVPRTVSSLETLAHIEKRYQLPTGYFRAKLPITDRCTSAGTIPGISRAERRRLAWHLPVDFDRSPLREREEILEWVRRVVISGSTEYRRFQAAAMKHRYAIRFPGLPGASTRPRGISRSYRDDNGTLSDPDLVAATIDAPQQLSEEMTDLVRFKTSILTAFGYQRNGVWGEETASQKVEHLGLMFGALAATPSGAVHGFGVPLESLTFGLLVFPIVWDWYIQWRERRRGFLHSLGGRHAAHRRRPDKRRHGMATTESSACGAHQAHP